MVDIQYEYTETTIDVLEGETQIFVDNIAPIGLDPQSTTRNRLAAIAVSCYSRSNS